MKVNFNNQFYFIIYITVFISLLSCKIAYAYLEPGTSAFLLQIIAASIISCLFFIKKISAFFTGIFKKNTAHKNLSQNHLEEEKTER